MAVARPGSTIARRRVAAVRRFNRFYTQHLGVLRDGWLDSPFSLTEARVLYEISERDARHRDRHRPRSRPRRRLSQPHPAPLPQERADPQGRLAGRWPAKLPVDHRARAQRPSLRSKRGPTARSARCSAGSTAPEQDHLVSAMRTVETMIAPAPKADSEIVLREPRPGDLGWMVARHAELYAQEYGWGENFEGVCAQIVADFVSKYDPACERCWIAEMDGRNVGCVFLVKDSGDGRAAAPAAGRSGGARPRAWQAADRRMRPLRARSAATEASRSGPTACSPPRGTSTRRAGFRLTSSEKRKSFGQDVVSEYWDLKL